MFFIYSGLTTGLLLGLGLGNVKIILIKNTLEKGVRHGMIILSGVMFSDFILISIVNFGSQFFKVSPNNWDLIFKTSGILFILIGISILIKTFYRKRNLKSKRVSKDFKVSAFWIGWAVNTFNPYNYLTWLGFSVFLNKYDADFKDRAFFFFFSLFSMIFIDALIVLNVKRANWLIRYKKQLSMINAIVFFFLGIKLLI
jgi:threonine/homoserine/homoserine lactone efflux protein